MGPHLGRRGALALVGTFGLPYPGNSAEPGGLGALAQANGITYGAAVQSGLLARDAAYAGACHRELGCVVPEWEGKFAALQPREGVFDFAPLKALLAWSRAAGIAPRGHALIWHKALPEWAEAALVQDPGRAQVLMDTHLRHVLATTRAGIRDWDVINEVVADPLGSDTPQDGPGVLRDSPWLRAMGPGYIGTALRLARAQDATLRLTLNEYGIEEDTPSAAEKRHRLLGLVHSLLEQGVPLDAIGLQSHLQLSRPFSPAVLSDFIGALRAAGLAVLVTELDIRESWDAPQDLPARDALVAERAYAFSSTALAAGVRTILTWGLGQSTSWLAAEPAVAMPGGRTHRGLPLDDAWQRTPMWQALARAFTGR